MNDSRYLIHCIHCKHYTYKEDDESYKVYYVFSLFMITKEAMYIFKDKRCLWDGMGDTKGGN
jgi:hypothetical protein